MEKLTNKLNLRNIIKDRLVSIAFFMETSKGFPSSMFFDKVNEMTDLEKLIFVNNFSKGNPKVIKPIHYNETH